MGSINPGKIRPEARLPRIAASGPSDASAVEAPLQRAVERYRRVHARCEAHMARGEGMDPEFHVLDRERRQAIQAVMAIRSFGPEDMKAKLDIVKSVHAWCGPDESVVPLAMHIAEEAVAFLHRGDLQDKHPGPSGSWSSTGRWLIGAASSVPAFILDRFGSG